MVTITSDNIWLSFNTIVDYQQTRDILPAFNANCLLGNAQQWQTQHFLNTNDTSADCWQKVKVFFSFLDGVWGVAANTCRSLLHSSQRRHTVRIEIVCSHGSACQLLHRICIIQQPRGRGERGAGESRRCREEPVCRKREHNLGENKREWLSEIHVCRRSGRDADDEV